MRIGTRSRERTLAKLALPSIKPNQQKDIRQRQAKLGVRSFDDDPLDSLGRSQRAKPRVETGPGNHRRTADVI